MSTFYQVSFVVECEPETSTGFQPNSISAHLVGTEAYAVSDSDHGSIRDFWQFLITGLYSQKIPSTFQLAWQELEMGSNPGSSSEKSSAPTPE